MKSIAKVGAGLGALLLGACAHLPSETEKNSLRSQQQEVKKIETALYGKDNSSGLFEQLKMCSLQLHDRVNPAESFEWFESMEKHSDKDYFADEDHDVNRVEYNMLVEKYKIYKQYSLAKKELYEHRVKSCQSDLKAAIRREKIHSEQEQAFLDKLNENQAQRAAASVAPATPAPAEVTTPAAPAAVEAKPAAAAPKELHEAVSLPPPQPLEPAQVAPKPVNEKDLEDDL